MTLDLSGITSENEFYTHHYLLAILENDLKDLFKEWNRRQKEEKIPTSAFLIGGLAREYFRLRSELSETKDEEILARREDSPNVAHIHTCLASCFFKDIPWWSSYETRLYTPDGLPGTHLQFTRSCKILRPPCLQVSAGRPTGEPAFA